MSCKLILSGIFISVSLTALGNFSNTDILVIKDNNSVSPEMIIEDAISAGYGVNYVLPELITYDLIISHRLTILSTGRNPNALINNYLRILLQNYVDAGGKLIIEGGQTAYISVIHPRYPAFQNKVLRVVDWISDNGGNLNMAAEFYGSELATVPNILPGEIKLDIKSDPDMDVCTGNQFTETLYESSVYPGKGGVIVYPAVSNPRIICWFFNYGSAENRSDVKNLLFNSIYNLIGNTVSVNQFDTEIPSYFTLEQNFPNPFNPATNLKYSLPSNVGRQVFVSLKVYNNLGREVAVLVNEMKTPGNYTLNFNAGELPGGVYFYKLTAGKYFDVKKMVLIK